jgi:integrase
MLYRVAVTVSLRRKECRALRPENFELDGDYPKVTLLAGDAKAKKETVLPIHPSLAERLRPWLATKPKGIPL